MLHAARPFVLGVAVLLAGTTNTPAAEPNTAGAPTSAAAVPTKQGKANTPAPKQTATPASQNTAALPASSPQVVTHLTNEQDSNTAVTDGLKSRLWQSRILPPDPNEDAATRAALQDLIQRLKTAGAERPVSEPAPAKPVVLEPAPAPVKSVEPTVAAPVDQPNLPVATPAVTPNAGLSPAAIERLNRLVKDPNQVRNPLEMADLLFLNNRLADAAVLYEKALTLTIPNDSATSEDRAWILFQLGTSLRQTDMTRARDTYLKLISEFPNSPWTELAKANGRLINWYESAKPQQLISSPARE